MRLIAKAIDRNFCLMIWGFMRGLGGFDLSGGLDGTRTRDPRRDRPVF